ncbi:MAG TPA: MtrB/PioB family decaheme-associated outer membrane protein [Burkholderiales bacterium]|nr:MtrB/PioB family decaheme-associated outer membrane protein [Burkholderiales bacterium]
MKANTRSALSLTALCAALAATCGPARSEQDVDIVELTRPGSSASFGLGYATNDGPRFGQYSGLEERGAYGLLDLDLVRREEASGTWLKLTGRNLGLDSRELRFEHNRQGDWGYFIELNQIPRLDPYTVSTQLAGIGTGTQTISGLAAAAPVRLDTRRDRVTLGFDKLLSRGLDLQVRFRNENKEGARLFGQGTSPGAPNVRFLTDPIDYTTRLLEVTLGYTGERLQLSGGYYGTDFQNDIPALNVVGGIAGQSPIALPPGNQSHQIHLAGGYNFTQSTRGTFKVAYTHQRQNEPFVTASATGRTDLGGKVSTTLLQLGLTARPLPKLSLLANLRYEDRDDKTPIAQYIASGAAGSTFDGRNEPRSIESTTGKLEASYALPMGFRLTGGLDYELKKRNTYLIRSVSHRDETEEVSARAELRRSVSETVTGALSYVRSERGGSPFLTNIVIGGATGSNLVHPLHLADRDRDKVRLTVNWQPSLPLSIQFFADYAQDKYGGRALGLREGTAQTYSLDLSYAFTDKWQGTAWISRNDTRAEQQTQSGTTIWAADLRNIGDAVGVGLRGKPYSWLEIEADLTHSRDKSEYGLARVSGAAAVAPLPDAFFDVTGLKLSAKYAVRKNTSLRLSYVYERWSTDDWTWTTWTYTDGTRVLQDPVQKVHFIGIALQHRWQ